MSTWIRAPSRRYHVSDGARQPSDDIPDGDNTALGVWADRLTEGGDRGVAEGEGVAEPDPATTERTGLVEWAGRWCVVSRGRRRGSG